jgi:hypothetical protein
MKMQDGVVQRLVSAALEPITIDSDATAQAQEGLIREKRTLVYKEGKVSVSRMLKAKAEMVKVAKRGISSYITASHYNPNP